MNMLRTIAAIALLLTLQACGGGGSYDDSERDFVGPPDCKAKPEQCI